MTIEQAQKVMDLYDQIILVSGGSGSIKEAMGELDKKLTAIADSYSIDPQYAADTKDRIKEKVLQDTIIAMGAFIGASADGMKNAVTKATSDSNALKKAFESFMNTHTGGNDGKSV